MNPTTEMIQVICWFIAIWSGLALIVMAWWTWYWNRRK